MSSKHVIKKHVEKLVKYLGPNLSLANFHMVDYFSVNALESFFSKEILEEINQFGSEIIIQNIFTNNYTNIPYLKQHIDKSREFILKSCSDVCISPRHFDSLLCEWGCEEFLRLKLDIFMNSKKSHEVDIMSHVCAALKSISGTSHLVDIGDGKGYLSSMLALHHKIPILGVDASKINTDGAVRRIQKLSKVWNSILKNNDTTKKPTSDLYKQITLYVDDSVNLKKLVSDTFLEEAEGIGLVGLHTCGNLATDCFKIFSSNEDIRTICNVGCCYHFINELYERTDKPNNESYGFPISNYLSEKKFALGRSARMIAAQSIERWQDKKQLPTDTIFYRSLFEVFLNRKHSDLPSEKRRVGRFRKPVKSFSEYIHQASVRIGLKINVTESEIDQLYKEFESRRNEVNLFYLLRGMLAPAIESLILLDRLLFLQERGYEKSFLVQMFDPVVSPRCYGIVAIK